MVDAAAMTETTPTRPSSPTAESQLLLRRLRSWPFLHVERRGAQAFLYGSVAGELLAALDLRTGALAVTRGTCLEVVDATSRTRAEAVLRTCVEGERFASQARTASP